MKTKKNKLIGLLATSTLLFVAGGVGIANINASAQTDSTSVNYASYLKAEGAAVRLNDTNATSVRNGIRFVSLLNATDYATLEGLEANETSSVKVDYGMLVAPYDYEAKHGAFSKANLFGATPKYYIDGVTAENADLIKLGGFIYDTLPNAKDSTDKAIYCSIVNIAEEQLTREFVGVAFIRITTNDVAEYYVAEYAKEESRSMAYVAQSALQDANNGLSDTEEQFLQTNYLDNANVSGKQYTYSVEHIVVDPTGKETVMETVNGDKTTIGTTVSATAKEYVGYTYDEEASLASDILYANNRTALKLYYTQDHHDLTMSITNASVDVITTGEGVTENYLLSSVESYQFTVTPTTGYNMNTTTVTVNGEELTADDTGVYTVDLSGYGTNDALDIVVNVKAYMPTVVAGNYSQTSGIYYKDLVSLTDVAEGEFEGSRKYVNPTSGNEGSDNKNWGESGLWFQEVSPNHSSASALQTFEDMGGYCIKMDFYLENATALCLRLINTTTTIALDTNVTIPSAYTIVDKEHNTKVNRISKGRWYTLYIVPGGENRVNVFMNGGSADKPSVMYIKNASYETEMPLFPTLGVHKNYTSSVSIEYQTSGIFEGAYKYTNNHGGRYGTSVTYGDAGAFFNEIHTGGLSWGDQPYQFFNKGYTQVKFDIYIEESVKTIDFRIDYTSGSAWNTVDIGSDDDIAGTVHTWNSNVWKFYDEKGNQVNTLAHNTWYTVVVTPVQGKWFVVQSNGVGAVMYFKNMEYLKASA